MPFTDQARAAARVLRSPGAALGTFVAAEVVAVVLITVLGTRYLWFFGDEWAFFTHRRDAWAGQRYGDFLFSPHNEHWVTLPLLWYSALFKLIGLHHYWPYLLGTVLAHAVAAWFLRLLLRRCGFGAWGATGVAAIFLFLGSGAENLTWGFQLSFTGAVAFGLVQLWYASSGPARPGYRDALGSGAAVLALMCSGVGITYVVVSAAALALCGRWRRAVVAAVVPGLVFAAWWLAYGRDQESTLPPPALTDLVGFVWQGLVHVADSLTGLVGAGAVLLVVALLALSPAVARRAEGWYLSLAAAVGAIFFYGVSALGRAGLGPEAALASRYVHVAAPLLLLALAPTIRSAAERLHATGGRNLAMGALLALALAYNVSALGNYVQGREPIVTQARDRIETAARLDLSGAAPAATPDPIYSPDLTVAALRDLVASGDFDPPHQADPQGQADAAAALFVTVGARPAGAAPVVVAGSEARPDGCYDLEAPGLALDGTAGSGFELRGPASGTVSLTVEMEEAMSTPLVVALAASGPTFVDLGGPVTVLVSSTSPGIRLCPGAA